MFNDTCNICDDCLLDEKIHVCCARHPLTQEVGRLRAIDGSVRLACPNLDFFGRCTDYDNRPDSCRQFYCERFDREELNFNNNIARIEEIFKSLA